MANLSTLAPLGTGKTKVASRAWLVWLRKTWVTVVLATCSVISTSTSWLTRASGGTVLSLGMSRPLARAAGAHRAAARKTAKQRYMGKPHKEVAEMGTPALEDRARPI